MERIVYKKSDGKVYVEIPAKGVSIQFIIDNVVIPNGGTDINIIDESELPSREHRDCWDISGGKPVVDLIKVQDKLNKILEKKSKKQQILSKLKITEEELRDLTK